MLFRTTSQRILLSLIAVLLVVNTCKDWMDFRACGLAADCICESGTLQLYLKFSMSLLLTLLAFVTVRGSFSRRGGNLLRLAFVFSLLADFSFSMVKALVPDSLVLSTVLGISFFAVFQIVVIYRHTRVSDTDRRIPRIYGLLLASMAVAAGLYLSGTLGLVPSIVAAYGVIVFVSMVVGILVPRGRYFPARNGHFIRWGMVIFFVSDALVGLSMLPGEDGSTSRAVAMVSNNFIWWTYVPAQLMLIRATLKPQA